jgi:hypothetical protein
LAGLGHDRERLVADDRRLDPDEVVIIEVAITGDAAIDDPAVEP